MRQPEQFKNDRSTMRRLIDTQDRLRHAWENGKPRQRIILLIYGESLLDAQVAQEVSRDVKADLAAAFGAARSNTQAA